LRESVSGYTEQVFKMYGGELVETVLEFDDTLIGVVYDKFGEDTHMQRVNEKTITATVNIQISPTFWGWLFQFAGKMKVITPNHVAAAFDQQVSVYTSLLTNEN